MQDYLISMAVLLILPALLCQYIYPLQGLFDKPDPANRDRSGLVWLLFAFTVWSVYGSRENNAAKWEVCDELRTHVGANRLPDVCVERLPNLDSD